MNDRLKILVEELEKDSRLIDAEGRLIKSKVYDLINRSDHKLLKSLLNNVELKDMFFEEIEGIQIFDKNVFNYILDSSYFLEDSYTKFERKIYLMDSKQNFSLNKCGDIVLSFPHKDCFLEMDSTTEEDKRNEVFLNDIIMKKDIDVLKEPKLFTNVKKYSSNKNDKVSEFSENDNLLINGNNLLAMYSLLPRYKGKIKLMYWDILYNTKNDEVPYNDSFKHSSWLVMMKNRLDVAKKLLSKDGVICIQCDAIEMHYLKVLMDEIFIRDNYISTITCKVKAPSGVSSGMQSIFDSSEYILVYAKAKDKLTYNTVRLETETVNSDSKTASQYNNVIRNVNLSAKEFVCEKDDIKYYRIPKGEFSFETLSTKDMSKEDFYNIRNDICRLTALSGGIGEKILSHIEDFTNDEDLFIYSYVPSKGRDKGNLTDYYLFKSQTVTYLKNYINVYDKTKEIRKTDYITSIITNDWWQGISSEGDVKLKNGKKPEILLKVLVELFTNKNDIVLDAYLGSGTTAAVCHKMGRRYIGIEQLNKHYNLAITRMINVINGDKTGISPIVDWKGGGSFISSEFAKHSQKYIDLVDEAVESTVLEEIWYELKNSPCVTYRVDINEFDKSKNEFKKLNLIEQKEILKKVIEKNILYFNYSEIDEDEVLGDVLDKEFNKSFYGGLL